MKKNLFRMMAVAMFAAAVCLSGCDKDPDPTNEPENAGDHYSIYFGEKKVAPLDTIVYTASEGEIAGDYIAIILTLENTTSETLEAIQSVELLQGPRSMKEIEICGGGHCPWDGNPYKLNPGLNPELPLAVDIIPSEHDAGASGLFKICVGDNPNLDHATIVYLRVNL